MSALIKDMKVPESCRDCPLNDHIDPVCRITGVDIDDENMISCRPRWCPLVELPEKHGRLIDADATMKQWGLDKATKYGNETAEQQHFSYSTMMMYEIVDILDDAPVIIEAEGKE